MEAFLKACGADEGLATKFGDLGVSSVDEIALCEVSDLCSDLEIDKETAEKLVNGAKDAGLLETRKAAIRRTWKIVEEALSVEATKLFYKHLFEKYPSVIPLFENASMDDQAKKLYKTVELATTYLDDVESLIPVLQELGERHALEWGAVREHYDAVGECLIWTLKTGLGDAWTPEVEDSWTWVYGVIATTMADAGDKALLEKRKALIKETWGMVEEALDVEATKLFYKHLFETYPAVIPLFAHADIDEQAGKLYKTVKLAVSYLDDMEAVIPQLEELGARHAEEWKTEQAHYDAVGECLVWTLKTGLQDKFTPDAEDAWKWVYGVLAKVMGDAGEKKRAELAA